MPGTSPADRTAEEADRAARIVRGLVHYEDKRRRGVR